MTTLRPFRVNDIFKFNRVNLDPLTETYGIGFYFHYLARWPEYFNVGRRVIKKNKNVLHQIEISHKIEFSQKFDFSHNFDYFKLLFIKSYFLSCNDHPQNVSIVNH